MAHILTDTSLPTLARAVEISRSEMLRNYGRSPRGECYEGADLLRVYTGVPEPFFNGVLRARLAPERVDEAIDAATAYFAEKRAVWGWVVGPEPEPADLERRLVARGLVAGHAGTGMGADLEAIGEGCPPPAGLEIVRVGDAETLATFVATYVAGFGMAAAVVAPMTALEQSAGWGEGLPYRRFLGFLGGQPVATTALFLGEQVAGIYHVSTVPAARRQGIGTALTRRALLEARAAGYRVAVLHASEAGRRIYRTLGFRECTVLKEYVPAGG